MQSFARCLSERGKPAKVATTALMRKLIVRMHAVLNARAKLAIVTLRGSDHKLTGYRQSRDGV